MGAACPVEAATLHWNPYSGSVKKLAMPALSCALLLAACGGGSPPIGEPPASDTVKPTVSLSQGNAASSDTITLTAAASDNVGVTRVEFYQGATLLATDTLAPFSYEAAYIDDRTNFSARAYDAAGNVGVSAAFNITTLNQGVWAWALVSSGGAVVDEGVTVFIDEVGVSSGLVALGVYGNKGNTRLGFSALGPIDAPARLQLEFSLNTDVNSTADFFFGQDSDGKFEITTDGTLFKGSGSIYNDAGVATQAVGAVMLQVSDTVTPTPAAQALAQQTVRNLALQAARQGQLSLNPLKMTRRTASTFFKR